MSSQPTTTREVLVAARKLIEKRECWASNFTEIFSGKECALTAITHVTPPTELREQAFRALARQANGSVAYFNDTHSHDGVLGLYDRAIASLPLDRVAV